MPIDPKDRWLLPEVMREEELRGEGVYGRYNRSAERRDFSFVQSDAITDDQYARAYATNLRAHLMMEGLTTNGCILDVGCAFGHVTHAIHLAFGPAVQIYGLDLSNSSTDAARKLFPDCQFLAGSADKLESFDDESLDIIHAREFYPFTRTNELDLHRRFLLQFARKLKPGGAAVAVQIIDRAGLSDTLGALQRECRKIGFASIQQSVVVPYRLYRYLGDRGYSALFHPVISVVGRVLENYRSGLVSYLYVFRKD